jgi:hypothetical protein
MTPPAGESDVPVRVLDVAVLSDDWYVLKKTTFEHRRRDGSWQRVTRETYDRGNLLDGDDPETCIRREAEEETGFRVHAPRKLFEAVDAADRVSAGGGEAHEGEDIELVELPLHAAVAMIDTGLIQDGKTIMLLQHAALRGLAALRR